MPASPAEEAGIRPEDLVIELADIPVNDVGDIQRVMVGDMIGGRVDIRLFRDGRIIELPIVPVELTAG